jgi:hypothetical protein
MKKLLASILLGLTAFGYATAQVATSLQGWDRFSFSYTNVTCKVAYYRSREGQQLVPAAEAQRSTNLVVDGVVLSVVEPAQFKGKVVTLHFDFPEYWDHWYLPDFLYRGQVHTAEIGRTNFLCDPGFVLVARPLPSSDPESLKKLLRHRVWEEHFAAAIKEQFGENALFEILYSSLTDTNQSPAQFADQKMAARLLVRIRPACGVSLKRAVAETLLSWNISVSDWPLYLWRTFGHEETSRALDEVKTSKLSATQTEAMEAWRYWLSGDEKDLVGHF